MRKWLRYLVLGLITLLIVILSLILKLSNNVNAFKITLIIIFSIVISTVSVVMFLKLKKDESFKDENVILSTFDWFNFVLLAISLILYINIFIFSIAKVDGMSMQDTLYDGDYLFIRHFNYHPEVKDIVIIHLENDTNLVKRVWAVEGDIISSTLIDDHSYLVINEEVTSYIFDASNLFGNSSYTLLKGEYFVLGDNIINSKDSRSSEIGIIKEEEIIGKYLFKF